MASSVLNIGRGLYISNAVRRRMGGWRNAVVDPGCYTADGCGRDRDCGHPLDYIQIQGTLYIGYTDIDTARNRVKGGF